MKNNNRFFILLAVLFTFSGLVSRAELDKYNKEALSKTQDFLKNKSERDVFIKNAPESQKHMDQMDVMGMNGDQKNQMFNISADVMGQITKDQNGDPDAMKKLLEKAQQNPEEFYKSLSPESRNMIKNLGGQIENSQIPKAPR